MTRYEQRQVNSNDYLGYVVMSNSGRSLLTIGHVMTSKPVCMVKCIRSEFIDPFEMRVSIIMVSN